MPGTAGATFHFCRAGAGWRILAGVTPPRNGRGAAPPGAGALWRTPGGRTAPAALAFPQPVVTALKQDPERVSRHHATLEPGEYPTTVFRQTPRRLLVCTMQTATTSLHGIAYALLEPPGRHETSPAANGNMILRARIRVLRALGCRYVVTLGHWERSTSSRLLPVW